MTSLNVEVKVKKMRGERREVWRKGEEGNRREGEWGGEREKREIGRKVAEREEWVGKGEGSEGGKEEG